MQWSVLSQTADNTVKVWSIPRQLHLLAVRLGVAVYVASTTLETRARLKEQYDLGGGGGPSRRGFCRVRGRILAPHIPVGSFFRFSGGWGCKE
jgi:hypothetical protein